MTSPLRNGTAGAANGGTSLPHHRHQPLPPSAALNVHVSSQKLRRVNILSLLLRFAAFSFSLTAALFMLTDNSSHSSRSWSHFSTFRFVFAANAIAAVYSFAEMGASLWELIRSATPLPEPIQLWFDFSHDQVFGYMLLAAEAVGVAEARGLRRGRTCEDDNGFCVQAYISVALGLAGFVFLAMSAVLSGYRVSCYLITGARFISNKSLVDPLHQIP